MNLHTSTLSRHFSLIIIALLGFCNYSNYTMAETTLSSEFKLNIKNETLLVLDILHKGSNGQPTLVQSIASGETFTHATQEKEQWAVKDQYSGVTLHQFTAIKTKPNIVINLDNMRSIPSKNPVSLTIKNKNTFDVLIYTIDTRGKLRADGSIKAQKMAVKNTTGSQCLIMRHALTKKVIGMFITRETPTQTYAFESKGNTGTVVNSNKKSSSGGPFGRIKSTNNNTNSNQASATSNSNQPATTRKVRGGNTNTKPAGNTNTKPTGNTNTKPPTGKPNTKPAGNTNTKPPTGNTNTKPPTGNTNTKPAGNTNTKPPTGNTNTKPAGNTNTKPPTGNTNTKPAGNTNTKPPTGNTNTKPAGNTNTKPPTGNTNTKPAGNTNTKPASNPNLPPKPTTTEENMEVQIFEMVNAHRVKMGLQPFKYHSVIRKYSRQHSVYMKGKGKISHDDFKARMGKMSPEVGGAVIRGENVAMQFSAKGAFDAWLASPGHRKNIEKPEFTHAALGVVAKGKGAYYLTHIFIKK